MHSLSPEAAKALNEQIALLARRLPGKDDPAHVYGFSCACGCGEVVPLTLGEYEADGAWRDGDKPPTPSN